MYSDRFLALKTLPLLMDMMAMGVGEVGRMICKRVVFVFKGSYMRGDEGVDASCLLIKMIGPKMARSLLLVRVRYYLLHTRGSYFPSSGSSPPANHFSNNTNNK